MSSNMPVIVDFKTIGTYKKLKDRTAVIGILPNSLNKDPHRYGILKEEDKMDLRKGCRGFRDEGYGDMFYSFFDCIKQTSRPGIPLKDVIRSDFVSTRRNLITFAASVHSKSFFVIRALRKNGVIFLCDKRSENEKSDNDPGYGYKFEQYMTLKANGKPHDEYERVSNAECIKAVLRTSFKKEDEEIKVLYAAEMDSQDSDGNFVEIKTTKLDNEKWIKYRSLSHYFQSFLGNVPFIIKGQIGEDQVVFKVDKIETRNIPHMNVDWDAEKCIEQLFQVLHEIKMRLEKDDQAIVIRIGGGQVNYEVENAENCEFVDASFLRYFE